MGVNHGGGGRGDEYPRMGSGGTLIQVVPQIFCHVSKFQALAMDSSPQISTQIYATGQMVTSFPVQSVPQQPKSAIHNFVNRITSVTSKRLKIDGERLWGTQVIKPRSPY
jgi:hypothetical protein